MSTKRNTTKETKSATAASIVAFRAYVGTEVERLTGLAEERAQFSKDLRAMEMNARILADRAEQSAKDAKRDIHELEGLLAIVDSGQKVPDQGPSPLTKGVQIHLKNYDWNNKPK